MMELSVTSDAENMLKYNYKNIVIEIREGDITTFHGDAIVNAANNHLWMGAGVAGAIKRKGGTEIEREAVSKGPIDVGAAVITGAGNLPVRYIIHAAVMGQNLRTDAETIYISTVSALKIASSNNVRSIALPALGTGVGGMPYSVAADAMLRATKDTIDNGQCSNLKYIAFYLFGTEAYKDFISKAKEVFD